MIKSGLRTFNSAAAPTSSRNTSCKMFWSNMH